MPMTAYSLQLDDRRFRDGLRTFALFFDNFTPKEGSSLSPSHESFNHGEAATVLFSPASSMILDSLAFKKTGIWSHGDSKRADSGGDCGFKRNGPCYLVDIAAKSVTVMVVRTSASYWNGIVKGNIFVNGQVVKIKDFCKKSPSSDELFTELFFDAVIVRRTLKDFISDISASFSLPDEVLLTRDLKTSEADIDGRRCILKSVRLANSQCFRDLVLESAKDIFIETYRTVGCDRSYYRRFFRNGRWSVPVKIVLPGTYGLPVSSSWGRGSDAASIHGYDDSNAEVLTHTGTMTKKTVLDQCRGKDVVFKDIKKGKFAVFTDKADGALKFSYANQSGCFKTITITKDESHKNAVIIPYPDDDQKFYIFYNMLVPGKKYYGIHVCVIRCGLSDPSVTSPVTLAIPTDQAVVDTGRCFSVASNSDASLLILRFNDPAYSVQIEGLGAIAAKYCLDHNKASGADPSIHHIMIALPEGGHWARESKFINAINFSIRHNKHSASASRAAIINAALTSQAPLPSAVSAKYIQQDDLCTVSFDPGIAVEKFGTLRLSVVDDVLWSTLATDIIDLCLQTDHGPRILPIKVWDCCPPSDSTPYSVFNTCQLYDMVINQKTCSFRYRFSLHGTDGIVPRPLPIGEAYTLHLLTEGEKVLKGSPGNGGDLVVFESDVELTLSSLETEIRFKDGNFKLSNDPVSLHNLTHTAHCSIERVAGESSVTAVLTFSDCRKQENRIDNPVFIKEIWLLLDHNAKMRDPMVLSYELSMAPEGVSVIAHMLGNQIAVSFDPPAQIAPMDVIRVKFLGELHPASRISSVRVVENVPQDLPLALYRRDVCIKQREGKIAIRDAVKEEVCIK